MKNIVVIGSLNMDLVSEVSEIPKVGETVIAKNLSYKHGGKGANQAMSLGKLGARVSMIGAIGRDQHGRDLRESLEAGGVDVGALVEKDTNTGMAFINVDHNSNNNIVVHPGANGSLTREDIDRNIDLIRSADYCVMQLEIPLEIVYYVIDICSQNDVKIILNPAPARRDLDFSYISKLDYLIPNETELEIILGRPYDMEDLDLVSEELLARGVKNLIVTLGEHGSFIKNREVSFHKEARKVRAIDTTGAGDSYIAGFTYSLAGGKGLLEAVDFATKVSSITVERKGAQESLPSLEEVKNIE